MGFNRGKTKMKRLLLLLLTTLALPTAVNADLFEKNNYKVIANNHIELDFLGLPRLTPRDGYQLWSEDKVNMRINYLGIEAKKVKVRGIYGRYISYKTIIRYYKPPESGTSTQIYSSGITSIDCFEIGNSISCSGTGPSINTIPGTPPSPGGTVQIKGDIIIDCLENTYQSAYEKFRRFKWRKIRNNTHMASYRDFYCKNISRLEPSKFLKYRKGKPNEKDYEALKVLPLKSF